MFSFGWRSREVIGFLRLPLTAYCLLALLVCALLGGCVVAPRQHAIGDERAACLEVFRRVDDAIAQGQVGDGMAARVAGFPYLRANRFLASYARDSLNHAQFADWMSRMIALGTEAYAVEIGNLPADAAEALAHELWKIDARYAWPRPAIAECTERLAALDISDQGRRLQLQGAARVPDDYVTWQRIAGLYWISRLPFAAGIRRWQEEVRAGYAQPLDALPVKGRLHAYLPPPGSLSRHELAGVLERAAANPLRIPDPHREDLEALFRVYAPEFMVDAAGESDVPGELGWGFTGTPQVVSQRPVVYRRASHTRYAGRALLQLNYAIWFPERPKVGGWDILGGRLDGVLWRVTLAPDGAPWVYDSIHLCGCYHLFFPTARAAARPQPDTLDEHAFVPQALGRVDSATRLTLRVASGTHYLERITPATGPARGGFEYSFVEDDSLRSLPVHDGGRRSVYRPDGIIPGSERGERYLFWPMGIPESGAMRQWGRHATAFVGRRHFDDPDLLERYFLLEDAGREQ